MKNQSRKMIGLAIGSFILFLTLSSCETWREDCTGQIIVENEIPDINLYVGGEAFTRDISEPPVVFRHTEKKITLINVMAVDNDIVGAGRHTNEDGKAYVIYVEAKKIGETEIRVTAEDECQDYHVTTTFNVTVIDTTNSKKY